MRRSSRAVIIRGDSVALIFRRKVSGGQKRQYYVLPGGGIEAGETPEQAVVREINEELSLHARVLANLGVFASEEHEEHTFLCEASSGEMKLGGAELERHSEENFYQPMWVKISEISGLELFYKPQIFDGFEKLKRKNNGKDSIQRKNYRGN